jgi:CBS domain-containing protein
MKTGYAVADAMTTKPVIVGSHMTIRDAANVMGQSNVGSLLVVDNEERVLGIVIAEDFVARATAKALDPDLTPIADIMTTAVFDTRPEVDIYDAMVVMREHDIFHLPVRDENEKLVGFLTLKDILRIEPQLFEIMAEMADIRPTKRSNGREGYCGECGNYAEELERVNNKMLCEYCRENA